MFVTRQTTSASRCMLNRRKFFLAAAAPVLCAAGGAGPQDVLISCAVQRHTDLLWRSELLFASGFRDVRFIPPPALFQIQRLCRAVGRRQPRALLLQLLDPVVRRYPSLPS
jgi:hypothetical protein